MAGFALPAGSQSASPSPPLEEQVPGIMLKPLSTRSVLKAARLGWAEPLNLTLSDGAFMSSLQAQQGGMLLILVSFSRGQLRPTTPSSIPPPLPTPLACYTSCPSRLNTCHRRLFARTADS